MSHLTLSIDDDVLRRARIRARQQGTSVDAVVRARLVQYAGGDDPEGAKRAFLDGAERSTASSGPGGRRWTRDELYDR